MRCTAIRSVLAAAVIAAAGAAPALADAAADFYKGNRITVIVAVSAGGGFDLNARILARHMGRHMPGKPGMIVQNMPGAGGVKAANYMYNAAVKDGTVVSVPLSSIVTAQVATPDRVKYSAVDFNWVGTITPMTDVISVWHTAPAKTIEEAKRTELVIGASTRNSLIYQEPMLMNALIGTRFKVIEGYKGGTEINLAMERGELHARSNVWASWKSQKADWLRERKIVHLVQVGPKAGDLDVPSFIDLVSGDKARAMVEFLHINLQMGRSVYATPGVPAARVAALRTAFMATMRDKAYRDEMAARKMDVEPIPGTALQAYVRKAVATPKEVVSAVNQALGVK